MRTKLVEARGLSDEPEREVSGALDNLKGRASVSSPVPMLGRMTSSTEVTEEVA
jgi:hypothetical protein